MVNIFKILGQWGIMGVVLTIAGWLGTNWLRFNSSRPAQYIMYIGIFLIFFGIISGLLKKKKGDLL